jgi:hypothetical protein
MAARKTVKAVKAVTVFLEDLPAPAVILTLSNLSSLGPQQLLVLTTLTQACCQDGVVRLIGIVETERPDCGLVLNKADDLLRKRLGTAQGFAELLEQTGDADAVGCLLILRRCLGALGQEFTRRTARGPARKVSKEQEALDLEQARPGQPHRAPAQLRPLARALHIRKSFGSGIEPRMHLVVP